MPAMKRRRPTRKALHLLLELPKTTGLALTSNQLKEKALSPLIPLLLLVVGACYQLSCRLGHSIAVETSIFSIQRRR